jgi:hypothetical protein
VYISWEANKDEKITRYIEEERTAPKKKLQAA